MSDADMLNSWRMAIPEEQHCSDKPPFTKKMPLPHGAVMYGDVVMIEMLLRRGLDVHSVDDSLQTPLHYVSRMIYRCDAIVNLLLEHGADKNAVDSEGRSAQIDVEEAFLLAAPITQ